MPVMSAAAGVARIADVMRSAREETLKLFDLATEDALRSSPGEGFRPILWHLAHIGVFEAYWILQKFAHEEPPNRLYERIFDPIKTPREESKELPGRGEIMKYLESVRRRVLGILERIEESQISEQSEERLGQNFYLFDLVIQHERQHQETIAMLLQMLPVEKKIAPVLVRGTERLVLCTSRVPDLSERMIRIPAGPFNIGAESNDRFVYDNELPAQEIFVEEFFIDSKLTTNEEYLRFIEENGYERREFWSEDGWAWLQKKAAEEQEGESNKVEAPYYWTRRNNEWHERRMFDEVPLRRDHPVCGVSWYEADAYARFMGMRLPTEAEWEKVASCSATKDQKMLYAWGAEEPSLQFANFGRNLWDTMRVGSFPAGITACGALDMAGNVWEWTSDEFRGFAGFASFPYPEYSEAWFDGDHRVLKGGSWATSAPILRNTFRNFFRRHFRIGFTGIRCASMTAA